ncbi:sulfur oxidation c-type cytochrome SoxX [Sulfurisoma sediminicola]|uniref:Monoheme cytochrome SoxX (Sulfur oxidation) n=1 Tax=Sulfurisoma sediminicola TaxID=1381557 RepID=A0A497XAR7_9PROT|nr:sulfur oxidation c-type cytochrome SoxX [Sulfurisoma sediminicola]RLJ63657.1 monoheme cytochrome SoxX (sulfur oxidation) [Sulfurisoma sediminicola]
MKTTARNSLVAMAMIAAAPAAFSDSDHRAKALVMMKQDFVTKGQATADRIFEDGLQAICNRTGNQPPADITKRLEADQMAGVKYPADGKLMGDWKEGEKIAQSGRGFTWTDEPGLPVGGNCYNCHQIAPKETSFGTVGPSLFHFGKLRGNTADMQKYVYSKIYNAKSYNVCSEMPRFGHVGALRPEQIRHLVALLLDPESPVNK